MSDGNETAARLRVVTRQLYPSARMAGAATPGDEVIRTINGRSLHLALNRPKKLNALSMTMIDLMTDTFKEDVLTGKVDVIVLEGAGRKAFCAGGDVARVREAGLAGDPLTRDFFYREYQLNHLIGEQTNAPQVSLWNGITMGGGIGLSVHGTFRVCTASTVFAKPECTIGFFPDVGGSHFLSRLPGGLGTYIGLTGARIGPRDLLYTGIATHYVAPDAMDALKARLNSFDKADGSSVAEVLAKFASTPDASVKPSTLEPHRDAIDRCFARPAVAGVLAALEAETADAEWAAATLVSLGAQSPTSLKTTLQMLLRGAELGLGDCLRMEFDVCQNLIGNTGSDFYEGVRSVLVDKDREPTWPGGATANDVDDVKVEALFAHIPNRLELPNL